MSASGKKCLTSKKAMRIYGYRQPGIQNLAEGLMPLVFMG
jgi:hypothetical protein